VGFDAWISIEGMAQIVERDQFLKAKIAQLWD